MGDAINLGTMRHLSGRPAVRGPEQAAWDRNNPDYAQRWGMFPQQSQQGSNAPPPRPAVMPSNGMVPAPYPPTSSGPMPMAPPRPRPPTPSKPGPGRPSRPMAPAQSPPPKKPQGGGFAAYSPGQAQPQPTPTPYKPGPGRPSRPMTPSQPPRPGKPQGGGVGIYSPGQARPQQSPYASSTPYGQQPQSMNRYGPGTSPEYMQQNPDTEPFNPAPAATPYGQQKPALMLEPGLRPLPGSPAELHFGGKPRPQQPGNRPPPFQTLTQNFDGTVSQMPNFQQRDAFIAQINNQLGQMQNQSRQRPGMGPPQFNFPQMWNQAGQMAQQGFRNPFAAPGFGDVTPGSRPPPPPPGYVY